MRKEGFIYINKFIYAFFNHFNFYRTIFGEVKYNFTENA